MMPKITFLGSVRFSPYEILATPEPLNPAWTLETHQEFNTEPEYQNACKLFYPAIDASDIVIVWAPEGIGEHTARDIVYAERAGKRIIVIGPRSCHEYPIKNRSVE